MSDDQPSPTGFPPRRRVSFEPIHSPLAGARGKLLLFSIAALACAGLSGYMAIVGHFPWTDMRVVAPGVGALWFALRVFMIATPRA
jgi:hypothetical protein